MNLLNITAQDVIAWCSAGGAILGLLGTLLGFIASNTKNKKLKAAAEKAEKLAKTGEYIATMTGNYVRTAETEMSNLTGAEKKQWVLSELKVDLSDKGLPFDITDLALGIEKAVELLNTNKFKDSKKE